MSQGFFRWDNLGQNCTRSAGLDLTTSHGDQSSPVWAILDVMSFWPEAERTNAVAGAVCNHLPGGKDVVFVIANKSPSTTPKTVTG
jgi:hypothetical protein